MKTEEITIESLAYGGDGVAHLQDGRAAFIAGALPGDTVLARILEDKERFVKGEVDQLVEASPDRVTPPCALAAAGRCGGCPWANLAYEKQLFWKRQAVVDAFSRIAKYGDEAADALVGACVASPKQWNYRNKVEFEVGQDVAGRFTLGMHARGGSFVPLAECKLCAKRLEKAPRVLTGSLRYAAGTLDLGIERVGIRMSERTKDVEVALWTSPGRFPRANVARVVSDGLPVKRPGVTRVLIKGDAKRRKVVGVESLAGHGCWSERIGDYKMLLSAPSFFQVNTPNAERLVELALEGLAVDGLDRVLDLYSGAGTFTLPLAERAQSVAAVEMEGSSVRDLRRNLEKNSLWAEVVGGDVARELAGLGTVDKVVVDPPRSGLGPKAVEGLINTRAWRIAYVSCNPTTLARDIVQFKDAGYEVRGVTPVDLFPQTYHVETVTILEKQR